MLKETARVTGMTPAISEARAPQMSRDSTSRPTSSVPRRWTAEGGFRMAAKSVAAGLKGARGGPRGEGDDGEQDGRGHQGGGRAQEAAEDLRLARARHALPRMRGLATK